MRPKYKEKYNEMFRKLNTTVIKWEIFILKKKMKKNFIIDKDGYRYYGGPPDFIDTLLLRLFGFRLDEVGYDKYSNEIQRWV